MASTEQYVRAGIWLQGQGGDREVARVRATVPTFFRSGERRATYQNRQAIWVLSSRLLCFLSGWCV